MSNWDELVSSVTHRLRIDPELRMDVSRELRAHLEDSAAEFREAGQSEQEAFGNAVKAFGDPRELSDKLWQANKGRIRLRGVLRWACRATLVPGAILVIIILLFNMKGLTPISWEQIPSSLTAQLSEEDAFILTADAKAISQRWPDNPIYYGNYVTTVLYENEFRDQQLGAKPEKLDEALVLLDKGKRIDPDNAYYDYLKAALLINHSSTISDDTSRTYEIVNYGGEVRVKNCWKIEISDKTLFNKAIQEFKNGLTKSEFSGGTIEMLDLRMKLLPEPTRLGDQIGRISLQVSVFLPQVSVLRSMVKSLSAYAVSLAEQGKEEQSINIITSAGLMSSMQGAQADTLIGLLVAQAQQTAVLAHQEQVYRELGEKEKAVEAKRALSEQVSAFNELRSGHRYNSEQLNQAGMLWFAVLPSLPGFEVDFEPMRTAEQYIFTEGVLMLLLIMLAIFSLLFGGATLLNLLARTEKRPVLVFVGWGRIAKIFLLAILLPLGVYAFYAYVLTASDRVYGLNFTAGKTILEFVVIMGVMFTALFWLSYSSIRLRAEQIGLAVPRTIRFKDRWLIIGLGTLISLAVAIYLIGWWIGFFKPQEGRWFGWWASPFEIEDKFMPSCTDGFLLAIAVAAFLICWFIRELVGLFIQKQYSVFRKTFFRSIVPIFAATVIVIGIACGWLLARAESSAVRRMTGRAEVNIRNEVENSDYRFLRDRFIKQHNEYLQEFQK